MKEFLTTSSNPVGHGLNLVDPSQEKGFACYSFVPKSAEPIKVIVLDDTQREDDGDTGIHGHRHVNTVKAFSGASPENSFWQLETSSLRDFPQQFRTFEIYLNRDNTVSIITTNVDPAVKDGTPAATSRKYAVAAQQIVNTNVYTNNPTGDPSVRPMRTGSYNAELVKQLNPEMRAKMQTLFP